MTTATAPAPSPARVRLPRPGAPRPHLRLLRYEPDPGWSPAAAPPRARRPAAPVPDDLRETAALRRRTHQVLCLVLEVLDGRRPLAHLAAHLDPSALRYVRAAVGRRSGRPSSRLTSLHVHRPRPDAVEVAAVHRAGGRSRALAARFEGRPEAPAAWRCVTVRLL